MQNKVNDQSPTLKEAFLLFFVIILECVALSAILEFVKNIIQDEGLQLLAVLIAFFSLIPMILITLGVFDWINIESKDSKLKAILIISLFLDIIIGELIAIIFIAYNFLAYYQNEMLIMPIIFIALATYVVAERTTETFFGMEAKFVNPFKSLRGRK